MDQTLARAAQQVKATGLHEQRQWPRYAAERSFSLRANLDGKIHVCQVADVSLGGARLVFAQPLLQDLNGREALELSHLDSETVTCTPIWQSADELGIQFDFSEDSLGLISVCLRNILALERTDAS